MGAQLGQLGTAAPFLLGAAGAGARGITVGRQEADAHNQLMQMLDLQRKQEGRQEELFPGQLAGQKLQNASLAGQESRAAQMFPSQMASAQYKAQPASAQLSGAMEHAFKLPSNSLGPSSQESDLAMLQRHEQTSASAGHSWLSDLLTALGLANKLPEDAITEQQRKVEALHNEVDRTLTEIQNPRAPRPGTAPFKSLQDAHNQAIYNWQIEKDKLDKMMVGHGVEKSKIENKLGRITGIPASNTDQYYKSSGGYDWLKDNDEE